MNKYSDGVNLQNQKLKKKKKGEKRIENYLHRNSSKGLSAPSGTLMGVTFPVHKSVMPSSAFSAFSSIASFKSCLFPSITIGIPTSASADSTLSRIFHTNKSHILRMLIIS